ncbi:metalloregulator ArsR/SmtB family transcription factor [Myceligenerans crystallogenes]|uniref:HTH arsR-type domain-containing protein n=1 Tax=Myceligenerans crystallogenes TaxID=316335 RepID=A0ABN2NBZ0_9MICO
METFEALGDPVRRRILEHLSRGGELSAGQLAALAGDEFAISQPAVSQHLKVLREAGLVTVRAEGRRRVYALHAEALLEAEGWLAGLRQFWSQRLDALETELRRGARERTAGSAAGGREESGRHDTIHGAAPPAPGPRRTA